MRKLILHKITLPILAILMVTNGWAKPLDPIWGLGLTLIEVDKLLESSNSNQIADNKPKITAQEVESSEINSWVEAQKAEYSGVSGLQFRAGYDRKYGDGSDDLYDDIYSYKNRFDAMISWNILKSGLIGRKANDKVAELEGQKLILGELTLLNAKQIRLHSKLQEQILDSYLNNNYAAQIEIYNSVITLLDSLLTTGRATSIELSQIKMEREILASHIVDTPAKVEGLLNTANYLAGQLIVDSKMVEQLSKESAAVEKSVLDQKTVDNEAQQVSYWDNASVSPYAKAQYYSDAGFTTSRTTANIGVSVTLPLFAGTKNRRTEVQSRSALAANATGATTASISLRIEECAEQLNRNLEQLRASAVLEQLYKEQIEVAKDAQKLKQLSLRDVAKYYIKLLGLQTDILEIISQRELLKTKLLLITI